MKFPRNRSECTQALRLIFDQELSDTIEGNSPNIKKQMSNSVPSQESDVRHATHLKVHSKATRSASTLSRRVSPQLRPHTTEGSRRRRTKSSESPSTISGREKTL